MTKDIGEASALLASGLKLTKLEDEGDFFWFVFEKRSNAFELSDLYWADELKVKARTYNNCYKSLKDRIFSRQGGIQK